jgi:hypothetical protein
MKQRALDIITAAFEGKVDKAGKSYIEHCKRVGENAPRIYKAITSSPLSSSEVEVVGL